MYAVTYYINGCRMRSVFKTSREAIWKATAVFCMDGHLFFNPFIVSHYATVMPRFFCCGN